MQRGSTHDDEERARWLRTGLALSGLSMRELRMACLAIGDTMDLTELILALSGSGALPDRRYDVIAQAINDQLIDLGLSHLVPSAAQLRDLR